METKKNYTFPLYPSTKKLLELMSKSKNVSQAQLLDEIIKEKNNRLKGHNGNL
jgi:hypothetical protein